MKPPISGDVAAGFEPVADAFEASFDGPAMGAALSVYLHGQVVVDLWGGVADTRTDTPWARDTVSVIFSCTKGLMSILAARLVQEGRLDYDAPVSRYWPEFAAAGKQDTQVRHLLSHRAGLSAPREPLSTEDILDWDRMVDILGAQAPLWKPGSGYAYHAITHGWLAGELIRRVTGKSVSAYFRETIAQPLDVPAWIGLPAEMERRVAHLVVGSTLAEQTAAAMPTLHPDWLYLAMTLGSALPPTLATPAGGFNDPRLHAAEIPGAGGITSAKALAKIWSATAWLTDGVRLLDPATLARATAEQTAGAPVFAVPPPWSRWGMGFQLDSETRRYLTPNGFGHDGAGGQVAFAEPKLGLGFAYLTNRMEGAGDLRATAIIDALRRLPEIARSGEVHAALA
jgi:CubicO group peptidase (beta-lactamase class C family)